MDASKFGFREEFYKIQLQGLLKDICGVYSQICQSGMVLPNDENIIRDEFGKYLQDDTYKISSTHYALFYQVDTEVREGANGRTDIRFLQVNPYEGQHVYFTIECKRLDGKRHLCKEYVDNGIRRFTTEKYPTWLGCNAMLGFVVCAISLTATVDMINSYLGQTEHLSVVDSSMYSVAGLESHHSKPHYFDIFHLWMDFSGLVSTN